MKRFVRQWPSHCCCWLMKVLVYSENLGEWGFFPGLHPQAKSVYLQSPQQRISLWRQNRLGSPAEHVASCLLSNSCYNAKQLRNVFKNSCWQQNHTQIVITRVCKYETEFPLSWLLGATYAVQKLDNTLRMLRKVGLVVLVVFLSGLIWVFFLIADKQHLNPFIYSDYYKAWTLKRP